MLNENLTKTQSSSAETESFILGNTINELNQNLIQLRKTEGNNIHTHMIITKNYYFAAEKNNWFDNKISPIKVKSGKMSFICFNIYVYLLIFVASSTVNLISNDSVNWNQLSVLFVENKYIVFTIIYYFILLQIIFLPILVLS